MHREAKRPGEQCRNWVVGGTVCNIHGVTGATVRKAERRVTLAQLMEQNPRHPWQVVLDATHMMDAIVRDFQTQLVAGETITPEQLDRLISVNQIRHHLATTAITTKAAEKMSLAFTQHIEMQGQMVATAIAAGLDKLGLTDPWRAYALEVAHWALLGESGEAQGDEPQPPTDPVVMESTSALVACRPSRRQRPSPATSPPWTMKRCDRGRARSSTSWRRRERRAHDRHA